MTGIFDNASTVMIGNKEVQSMKIGTAVIYEKSGPAPAKISTYFYRSGSYLYLRDVNDNPLANKSVKDYRNGNLRNTLTTNSNGRISYSSRDNYVFEGDSTYEGCTYP